MTLSRGIVVVILCIVLSILPGQRAFFSFVRSKSNQVVASIRLDTPIGNRHSVLSKTEDVDLVIASLTSENTSWYHESFPQWQKKIYIVDNPGAPLTVPKNKGREAMVYLTYVQFQSPHIL